jgi:outer membrane protein assembly factor BamB
VDVVGGNKEIIVLDKSNRKLWQSSLAFNVVGDSSALEPSGAPYGQGPCVERKGSLYVFDQGVLSAFDLRNGNARWRLPSVGIAGLFFDERDMMYVNATTASHESLKYSRQIDLSQKVTSVVLKVDSRNGKILWSSQSSGLVNYVSGKFVFAVQQYMPEEEDDNPYKPETGFEARPYMRIRRLDPANGREMWQHFQQRAPLDVAFDKNTIRLVFKKEVQVLKCFSF